MRERSTHTRSPILRYFAGRIDGLTSAFLVFPLFLVYQLGILSGRGHNGVDLVTSALIQLAQRDVGNYLMVLGFMLAMYAAIVALLARRGSFHPRAFLPMLAESGVYAVSMGSIIVLLLSELASFMPGLTTSTLADRGLLDVVVISAGAGFHEELIFRVVIMGGLGWLLAGLTGRKRAWIVALLLSSLAFSLAHHVGPMGEAFTFGAFVYRTLAGIIFALIYHVRGFAVAAWTHALYDLYVLGIIGS